MNKQNSVIEDRYEMWREEDTNRIFLRDNATNKEHGMPDWVWYAIPRIQLDYAWSAINEED